MINSFLKELSINEDSIPIIYQLAEAIPGGFFIYHADGDQKLIFFNSRMPALFGCDGEEDFKKLVGNSFKGIVHPGDYARCESEIKKQIKNSDDRIDHVKYRIRRKDGSIGVLDDYGHFSHSEAFGDIYYVFVQDITEQEERRIRFREELINQMLDGASLFLVNPQTNQYRVLYCNHYFAEKYNYGDDYRTSIEKYINTDVHEIDREMMRKAVDMDNIIRELKTKRETTAIYRDNSSGVSRWCKMRAAKLSDTEILLGFENHDKEYTKHVIHQKLEEDYFAMFVADIDAGIIKVAKKSQWYQTVDIGETVPYALLIKDLASHFVGDTKEFFERLLDMDYVRAELTTANKIACTYKSPLIEGGRWVRVEALVLTRHADGTPAVVALGFRLLDVLGSERQELQAKLKEAHKALQDEKKRYDILHELIHSGQWSFKLNAADEVVSAYYSQEGQRMVKNDFEPNPEAWRRLIHPDDRKRVIDAFDAAIVDHSGQTLFDETYRMQDRNGLYNWFHSVGKAVRQEDGSGEIFGIHVDITDRINEEYQQQEQLRQTKEVRAMIDRFVQNNKATFIVNAIEDSYRLMNPRQEDYDTFGTDPSFTKTFQGYAGRVYEPDREMVKSALDLKNILEWLEFQPEYSIRYRGLSKVHTTWFELRFSKLSSGMFILAIADVTETAVKELAQNAISENSYSIFLVDLFTNTMRVVKREGKFSGELDKDVYKFTEIQSAYIKGMKPANQAKWQGLDTVDGMRRFLKDEDRREIIYESPYRGNRLVRCTWQVIERIDGEATTICYSFMELDDEQADREKLNVQIAQQLETIGGVASEYTSLYHVNLLTGEYKPYTIAPKIADIKPVIARNPRLGDMLNEFFASDLVLPEYRERLRAFYPSEEGVRRALADKKKISVIFERDYGGEILWTEGNIIKCEKLNEPAHMAVVGFKEVDREVRTRMEQQEKLEAALKNAEVANKSKTSFLFNMSHDIRTPMNAIKGFTTMALKYLDDKERAADYLKKIHVSGRQLLNLINQVLEMSRIESGKIEFDNKPVNIKEKFDPFVTIFAEQAKEKGIDFHFAFSDIRHYDVLADELRIGQIMLNIVGNALKYTPEGGRIDFVLQEKPCEREGWGRYTLTVADTGIGMSEEYLKVIFEPFTREKSTTVSHIQGTGLGMSIVKKLVDLMEGTIDVRSELGRGTQFDITIDLPLTDETEKAAEAEPEVGKRTESFDGRRVLLVEDNELNREIAKDILEEFGMIVEEADDGDVAVSMVKAMADCDKYDYYDLVLMDIQMPTMNGYEATKAIRSIPGPDGFHLPIIAMTANAFEEDRRNAFAAGMDDHLAKPIEIDKLLETLARFL